MAYLTPYSFYQLCREYEVEMDSKNFYSLFLKYIINDYNIYKLFNKFNLHDLIQKVMLSSNDFPNIKIKKREYRFSLFYLSYASQLEQFTKLTINSFDTEELLW